MLTSPLTCTCHFPHMLPWPVGRSKGMPTVVTTHRPSQVRFYLPSHLDEPARPGQLTDKRQCPLLLQFMESPDPQTRHVTTLEGSQGTHQAVTSDDVSLPLVVEDNPLHSGCHSH